MESLLTLIGFGAVVALLMLAVVKTIETVWFFQGFRKEVEASLKRIEETLNKRNP